MIQLLSKDTIDKIAAGEVIERPLSVVKELVENSIDAGSGSISVEISGGGIEYIKVTDNGMGIAPDEVEIAFVRHATSKISGPSDLFLLNSLGFRGEALASICAISNTTLITKRAEDILGTKITLCGGEKIELSEIAAPNGSTFIITDFFFNTPARKKFLKSPNTEGAMIEEMVKNLALSRPDISFRFISNKKEKLFTSGRGDLKQTIFEIYGLNTAENVLDIDYKSPELQIHGYIGKSVLYHGTRKEENIFIDNRYIKNSIISKAIENSYIGFLMQHQFPFCVLNLYFPKGSTDVNVHPSKMEVRFDNPDVIKDIIEKVLSERLKKREDIEELPLVPKKTEEQKVAERPEPFLVKQPSLYKSEERAKEKEDSQEKNSKEEPIDEIQDNISEESKTEELNEYKEVKEIKEHTQEVQIEIPQIKAFLDKSALTDIKVLGQVFNTYWLFEYDSKLYILDQHAAHEKVLYEKLMKRLEESSISSQRLMPPIIVSLSATEIVALEKNIENFKAIGYDLEPFGGMDYSLKAIPYGMPDVDPKDLFYQTLIEGMAVNTELMINRVASISCKAAVKGNNKMSFIEIKALIEELMTLENPYHCPHGRPTVISFTKNELDKKFKRIL